MYRKRPFATRGRERRPARAVVCRIPCRILCLANVEQSSAGGTAFRTDGYQRYLGPCHQLKRVQTIDVVSMNDAVYSCTHKGCSRPQVGLQSHTISPAAAMNRPTKAGASTPATLDEQLARVGIIEARSTKAGASTPATRGAVGDRRGVLPRSTKAGASTPATRKAPHDRRKCHERSTKAGASTPATLLNSAKGQYRDKPSLVHGCGSLDNDAFASISRDFGRYPVRMVGIKQSRLP